MQNRFSRHGNVIWHLFFKPKSYRAVVNKLHVHHCTKFASLNFDIFFFKFFYKIFIQFICDVRSCCLIKRLMKISHVIRGEDHISNTFKQILIFEALGAEVPKFGHLGMILAPDRSKLSKRHGATAVSEFVEKGYLTDALINFVALLGWSPSDGQEIKTVDEIAQDFRIHEISSSNSIFEYDKLNWMNSHYIKMLSIPELKERLKPFLTKYDLSELTDAQYTRMVEVTYEPLTLLSDITDAVPYFFGEDVVMEDKAKETLETEVSQDVLKTFMEQAKDWEWTEENLHEKLEAFRAYYKEKGVKPKVTMWAIRAAVTGRTCGADMTAILAIIGKDKTFHRVKAAMK